MIGVGVGRVRAAGTTSEPPHLPLPQNSAFSVPYHRTPELHDIFIVERGRADSGVRGFGEETASISRVDSPHPWFDDGQTQTYDFSKIYSNSVEQCFNACYNDFTSKAPSLRGVGCVGFRHVLGFTPAYRFLQHSEHVSVRFAELNAGTRIPSLI